MRLWLREHSPAVGAFLALTVVAGALSLAMPVPTARSESGSPLPATSIPLPGPGEDADHDSYADGADLADGDLYVTLRLEELAMPGDGGAPYVLVGTDDDHWRTGAGGELEWRHVVDPDSLGHRAGSLAWQSEVLRTGQWWMSRPADGSSIAIAEANALAGEAPAGAHWPQTVWANVRDDRPTVTLRVELRDASASPHLRRGDWRVEVDVAGEQARPAGGPWRPLGQALDLADGAARLQVVPELATAPNRTVQQAIAERWAPTLRMDSQEAFVPVAGGVLERFHGFTRLSDGAVDLRTWDFTFNAGRDGYRLFLADFTGDGDVDHLDAQAMAVVLEGGALGAPTVHADVAPTLDGQIVVQYWFLYFYNFVLGDDGGDVDALQHKGDREFVQLVFPDVAAALNGTPTAVAFSQHYAGLRLEQPDLDALPFADGQFIVHVARGSHATYPAPGDDRRLRSSLTSIFDRFDGDGRVLDPGNYTLALLSDAPWHAGYKWGPVTRYTRDLGTSSRPFLQHDFRYPFTDPLWWQASLETATPDELAGMYGRPA